MSEPDFYLEHFGLDERPFTLLPDPDFLFWSSIHRRAYTVLEYGILSRAPITLLTGEVGAGKTTLLQNLLKSVSPDVTIALVSNAQGGRGELARWVLNALDQRVPVDATYVDMFHQLEEFLLAEYASGRRVLLVFDEAQHLSFEGLEELRMLTNVNSNKDELLQLVLVGQPELRDMVRRPDLKQFAQRIVATFHLPPMDADTVYAYIQHRMRVAGGTGFEIKRDASDLVSQVTSGVPRLVNQLCDISLLYAWTMNRKTVQEKTVEMVLNEGLYLPAAAYAEQGEAEKVE